MFAKVRSSRNIQQNIALGIRGCSTPLTDAVWGSAKPGPKRRRLSDGGGLQLWVQTSGSRLWQLIYRFNGNQRPAALGTCAPS